MLHLSPSHENNMQGLPGGLPKYSRLRRSAKRKRRSPTKIGCPSCSIPPKNCFCLRYNSNNSFLHLALLNSSLSSIRPIEYHLALRKLTKWVSKKSSSARPASSLVTMSTISVWSLPHPQQPQGWMRANTIQSSMLRSINSPFQPSMSPHPQPP